MTEENKLQLIIDLMEIDGFEKGLSSQAKGVIVLYSELALDLGKELKLLIEENRKLRKQINKHHA